MDRLGLANLLLLKRNEQGFTLVEMLAVLFITMTMTALAMKALAGYTTSIQYEQAEVLHELILREAQASARDEQQFQYARFDKRRGCMATGWRTPAPTGLLVEHERHCYPMPHVTQIIFGEGLVRDDGFSFSTRGHMSNGLEVFAIQFEDGHMSIFRIGLERGRIWPAGY